MRLNIKIIIGRRHVDQPAAKERERHHLQNFLTIRNSGGVLMKKFYIRSIGIIVLLTGSLYFLVPLKFVPSLSTCSHNPDLLNIIRCYGALYIALAVIAYYLSTKPEWIMRCISGIVIIMIAFLAGRIFSMIVDGIPDKAFIVSAIVEMVYAVWGIIIIKGYTSGGKAGN